MYSHWPNISAKNYTYTLVVKQVKRQHVKKLLSVITWSMRLISSLYDESLAIDRSQDIFFFLKDTPIIKRSKKESSSKEKI